MSNFNITEIASAFVVLFAIIDILGAIPVLLSLKNKQQHFDAAKACLVSFLMFILFFFAGRSLLSLFNIDVASFALAGSFVIFVLALEMILGIDIIKNEGNNPTATIVPIAFPLIAGPGALTTFLSLRAEYHMVNNITGLLLNLIIVYFILRYVDKVERIMGGSVIFILRKFFGVMLLAIAVKMFATNFKIIIAQ